MQRFAAASLRDVLYYEASFGRERPTVSSVAAQPGFNGNFVPKAKGVTWKYRTLQGVSKEFVLIEKAMYRTLLATCGLAEMLAYW